MAKLLKPKGPWNGKLVALDDGHGMQTPGKRTPYIPELGREIRENEFNRKVVGFLADILLAHGFRVLLVAPTDTDTPLSYRTNAANQHKADIYVSVHFNAMSFDFDYSSADGISVHVYLGNMKYDSGKLARAVGKYLRQGTNQDWRGFKEDNFHVLRETNMPAILTENGFMDDRKEALLMLNEDFQMEVAIEHAQGICEYFNVKYKGLSLDPLSKGWLEIGNKGESVKELQQSLKELGYSLNVDGLFGSETEKALKGFQKAHHLTVDGLYGPNTQKTLKDALKRYAAVANKEEEETEVVRDINKVSEWAKENWEEATENGYFDGKRPGAEITREETSIVVNRLRNNFLELIKKNEEEIQRLHETLEAAGVEIPEE
ncbi:N-acetylmuramoyl-L-alanine amidase [Halobacillus aidingensis]|uniref:N-acetylmuramoyl-L-alanine amidase n=1 Tax=Halobacillus aidingensis TaxID=240303 RepID=A0A1H0ME96_HALAD|nr:N-acetylmuramoyl-L-alanine amidase [Halobacillus aidingensis]SDO78661.1 N-acetylmuramoyl-L-alanine amidase [Halobacillus aidingensis]